MSNTSLSTVQLEEENSILSFYPGEDDAEIDDRNQPEENVIKYENTYRLESKNPFNEHQASIVISTEIEKFFNEMTKYNPYEAAKTCAAMSLSVRNNVYDLGFERYKIVCVVQVVEKKNQGMLSVAKLLRDSKKDKYVAKTFENNYLSSTVFVAALYYE